MSRRQKRIAEMRQWLSLHNRMERLNHARRRAGQEDADIDTAARALVAMEIERRKSAAAREELRIAREWLA